MRWNSFYGVCGLLGFVFTTFLLFSCTATRKAALPPAQEVKSKELSKLVAENEFDFQLLSGKFQAEMITESANASFSGTIRMQKDSAVWLSLSPVLGIEMFRVLFTRDSLFVMNRMAKSYYAGSYSSLHQVLEMETDFFMLQSLLCGNDFKNYETESFVSGTDGIYLILSSLARLPRIGETSRANAALPVISHSLRLDANNYRIIRSQLMMQGTPKRELDVVYGGYREIGGKLFPFNQAHKVTVGKPSTIHLRFDRLEPVSQLSFPFTIPSGYSLMRLVPMSQ